MIPICRAAAVLAAVATVPPAVLLGQDSARVDSARVIRSVELRRHSIFAPTEATSFLPRLANSLHFTTRSSVIRRELLFRTGAPYDSASVAETARNLRGVGVFRRVVIDSIRSDSGLVLRVTTGDGWTTRPEFRFGSTGSSVVYTLSLEELNFLGTATRVGVRYRKNPDRSTVIASFRQPRLLAGNVGLQLQYEDRSDGSLQFASIYRPFFALTDRTAWAVLGDTRQVRILKFFDGSDQARDTLQRRYSLGSVTLAHALRADREGYLRVGLYGQIRRDDYSVESGTDTLGHTVTGALGAYLNWRKARFLVSTGLQGFAREEDVDVSTQVGVGLYLTPRRFGYTEDGVVGTLGLRTGFGQVHQVVQLTANATGRLASGGLDSASVHLSATGYLLPARRHFVVFHAASGWQRRPAPGAEFDLGLGLGPRAFRQHAFTGDRAFFTSAEYRWTITDEFLKLSAIGVAGFLDYGGAWYHGFDRRTGWDAGVGLRFGPTRTTGVRNTRLDLAYRGKNDAQAGGWVIVFGAGFAFTSSGRLDF